MMYGCNINIHPCRPAVRRIRGGLDGSQRRRRSLKSDIECDLRRVVKDQGRTDVDDLEGVAKGYGEDEPAGRV